jgi:hypothetical protein
MEKWREHRAGWISGHLTRYNYPIFREEAASKNSYGRFSHIITALNTAMIFTAVNDIK